MRLIDAVKIQAKCESCEELKNLSAEEKVRLAVLIEERVPSGMASIEEWNEVILCFADTLPEASCIGAKNKLLSILRSAC